MASPLVQAGALALDVLRVVERNFSPATGAVEARALSQSGFEALCREMGLVNADWGGRLFAAIDADNTGAISPAEFLEGLRTMGALPAVDGAAAAAARRGLAFRMLDLDGDGVIDREELRDFVRSFAAAAREVTEGWVGQFEALFGGTGALREQPELRHTLLGLNVRTEEAIDELCDAVTAASERAEDGGLAGGEEGGGGAAAEEMTQQGFDAWCARDGPTRLGIEAVLEELARAWAGWMSLTQRERESGASLIPRQDFAVQAVPGLGGRLDRLAERGMQPLFEAFASHGQMSESDFHRCLARLGVTSSHVRSRLFAVFGDGSNFVDSSAFARMTRALMDDDEPARHYLAFRLFDTDDNGFVTETEVADFVSQFFGEATDAADSVLERSSQLFGSSATIHVHVKQTSSAIMNSYTHEVVSGIFDSGQDIAPGPGGQRRVYVAEFATWLTARGNQVCCYFDSLAKHLLDVLLAVGSGQLSFAEPASAFGTESPEVGQLLNPPKPEKPDKRKKKAKTSLPSATKFTRHKVKKLQDLFTKVSQDGVMGPPEWRRCLTAAGIHNTFVVERLFEIFDSSEDQRMTAKEFTSGLSELVSDADPRSESESAAVLEARRRFAFRFYDQTGENFFEREDCVSFLKSWVTCARDAVRLANERFLDVYGVDQLDLTAIQSPVQAASRSAVTDLYKFVYNQLDEYCTDVWREFAVAKGERMANDEFGKLAVAAPQVLDWLTELGTTLGRELEKLRDMNFEGSASTVSEGTELSVTRMKQTFAASAHHGSIDQPAFKRCIRNLMGTDSPGFAAALFRAIDVNKNGALSQDEFVDAFTTVVRGTTADKANIAFRIHDVRGAGYLEPKTLRSCFSTWLEPSLNKVDVLTNSLEQWINGRVDASGDRKGALHCFDAAGRLRNMEIASRMRKASAREVAMMADALVEHAMLHAKKSRQQLFPEEFARWVASTDFLYWMEGLGRSWMVSKEQLEAETPPSEKRRARTAALLASATSERERLAKLCPKGEGYFGLQARSSFTFAGQDLPASQRADIWWVRCFGPRHAMRRSIRPRTTFDQLTLPRLWQTVERHVVDRTSFDRASFGGLMHQLRIENPLIIVRLFEMFDVNNDGNLSAEEVVTGLALLSRGGASDRLRIVFNTFDVGRDGVLSRQELQVLLRAFCCIAMGVIDGLVSYLSDVCGLVRSTEASSNELKEFQQKLATGARAALQKRTATMLTEIFATRSGDSTPWEYFELWSESTPNFARWIERLGLACLESLVPLEVRLSQQHVTHRAIATCCMQRKWPDGNPLRRISTAGVREAVIRYSRGGRLDASQFRACLRDLNIRSPLTGRRMFNLLDRDVVGSVAAVDTATCLLLLCAGSVHEKLQAMWTLWDHDDHGFLSQTEVGMVFECLYLVAMDTVNAALAVISEVIVEVDSRYSHNIMLLSHGRLRAYIAKLLMQLAAYGGKGHSAVYFEKFWEWAKQREEFVSWLVALADSWTDSCLEYEAELVPVAETASPPAESPSAAAQQQVVQLPQDARSATVLEPHVGLPVMGPGSVYPCMYSVKKQFRVVLGNTERRMRLAWTNPYAEEMRARFVSERPDLLACSPPSSTVAAGREAALSLVFAPRAAHQSQRNLALGTLRLWVHNERAGANEECIAFHLE